MSPVKRLLSKLPDAKRSGKGWRARCPAHDDQQPSLSIAEGDNGRALVNCHAGCTPEAIVAAVGLALADLMPITNGHGRPSASSATTGYKSDVTFDTADEAIAALERKHGQLSTSWQYCDANAEPIGYVIRWDKPNGKDVRPISRTAGGRWTIGGMTGPRPLYQLPSLLKASKGSRVYVCEGEKAVDAARSLDLVATTSAHGSKSASKTDWSILAGYEVIILPDADDAGEAYAKDVAVLLAKLTPAPSVKVVRLPDLPFGEGADMADFVAIRNSDAHAVKADIEALANTAEVIEADDPWPDIHPLSEPIDVPFPVDVLPDVIRRWVKAEAEATQTPAELAALLAMAVIASAVAKRVMVEPWPGWREPLNLFVTALLEPGNRKSTVFSNATKPLRELESRLADEQRPYVERALAERRIDEARLKKLEKIASENDDPQIRDDALALAARLADEPIPSLPRLIADNATPEKLEMLLADQQGRIASMSAEGGVFDIMAGRYSDGAASFDVYLKGHAGDDLRTDRAGRAGVHVEAPALTCPYAIQPAVIAGLADKPAFRGRGLLARFLYAVPRSLVGRRSVRPDPVPVQVRQEYFDLVQRVGVLKGERILQLDLNAKSVFEKWMAEVEVMLDVAGDLEHMKDWGSKLAGLTLRLAGIMHMASRPEYNTIDHRTMSSAIELAKWSIPHAEAALNLMRVSGAAHVGAGHVWEWIRRRGLEGFTGRDAWQTVRRRFDKRENLDDALYVLVERGYIRPVEQNHCRPGRKSQLFEVRPALRNENPVSGTQNTQKVTIPTDGVDSVDFVYESDTTEHDTYASVEGLLTADTAPAQSVHQSGGDSRETRNRAAQLIRNARRNNREHAEAIRDAWAERLAICVADSGLTEDHAEQVALAELETMLHF